MFIVTVLMVAGTVLPAGLIVSRRVPEIVTRMVATARIVTGQRVTADEWEKAARGRRKDVIMRGADGQWLRLRLIEHE